MNLFLGIALAAIIFAASACAATTPTQTSNTTSRTSSYTGATHLVIDYDYTYVDVDLQQGESGLLTLVIKNVGGYDADDVEIYVPTVGDLNINKRFNVGLIESGESKTVQTTIRVGENASIGLHTVQARLSYDGYTSRGEEDNNLAVTLELPLKVYGNPAFQVKSEETTYYKDTVADLKLDVSLEDPVKDLKSTISSTCLTVIGSAQKQLGDKAANQDFTITYSIKPAQSGACTATLLMDYRDQAGQEATSTISLGLNIEDAGVDFKIINITYEPTGPGEKVAVKTAIKNVGKASAEDVTLTMTLSDPFTTADTAEKYVGTVKGGETVEETFNLAISWDAETAVYSVPLNITYKVGGTTYSVKKDVGIDVGGQVILEIIEVDSSGSSLKIDIANIGTRTADSVKATLIVGDGAVVTSSSSTSSSSSQTMQSGPGGNPISMLTGGNRRQTSTNTDTETQTQTDQQATPQVQGNRTGNSSVTSQYVSYKSDIKATKQTTFTFDTMISGTATLLLEYNGANNERITQRIPITVGSASGLASSSTRTFSARSGGTDTTTYLLYGAGLIIVLFVGYKYYKKRKNK